MFCIKVNIDAALLSNNSAGIGGVFRDNKGRFLLAFGFKCTHWDISLLELMAVWALKKVIQDWIFEYNGLIIEGDNVNIIKILQRAWKEFKNNKLMEEDLAFLMEFNQISFNFAGRSCNKLAHLCANFALHGYFIWEYFSSMNIPTSFMSLLKKECDAIELL
ncbi:hypothetical protein IEQ34_019082 [Dendrobium chrysotoxum]|uniref:RNase H type-1 domain-containing protein n=1 Tax=Dendrobium chrysotoxum TaxID=161865 RepID=A0AAV7G7P3_DENCH|nr:hypothetical protein IEQ34_019082 [Dendrobium chrysotoxum]